MNPQLFESYKLCQQVYHLARYSGPFILSLAVIQAGGVGESLRKHLRAPLDRRRNPPPTKSLDTVLLCLSFCWRLVRRRRCPGRAALPPPRTPSLSPRSPFFYNPRCFLGGNLKPLGTIISEQVTPPGKICPLSQRNSIAHASPSVQRYSNTQISDCCHVQFHFFRKSHETVSSDCRFWDWQAHIDCHKPGYIFLSYWETIYPTAGKNTPCSPPARSFPSQSL